MADAAVDTPTTALPLGDLGPTRRIRRHDGSGRYWPAGGGGHRPGHRPGGRHGTRHGARPGEHRGGRHVRLRPPWTRASRTGRTGVLRHDGTGRHWPRTVDASSEEWLSRLAGRHHQRPGRWPVRGLIEPTGALTAADIAAITAPDQETRAS